MNDPLNHSLTVSNRSKKQTNKKQKKGLMWKQVTVPKRDIHLNDSSNNDSFRNKISYCPYE